MRLLPMVWWHAWSHRGRNALLVLCVAVAVLVPVLNRSLATRLESAMRARAQSAPLVVGARGGRFDLVLAALYFRGGPIDPIEHGLYQDLSRDPLATAIPIHARATAQGSPVVATDVGYFQRPGTPLRLREGRLFVRAGEAVVGAQAAESLGLSVGDRLPTDRNRAYDIAQAAPVVLRVVGVLQPTGTSDDQALFVDLETAWVIEGFSHAHAPADAIDRPDLVIARGQGKVALSEALRTEQEITQANADRFHVHGSKDRFPLTAVLLYPADERADTILRARLNAQEGVQAIAPAEVVDELMAVVVRIGLVLDAVAILLLASTAALLALIVTLTVRLRQDELRTLGELGAARRTGAVLVGLELAGIVALGWALALGLAWCVVTVAARLSPFL